MTTTPPSTGLDTRCSAGVTEPTAGCQVGAGGSGSGIGGVEDTGTGVAAFFVGGSEVGHTGLSIVDVGIVMVGEIFPWEDYTEPTGLAIAATAGR